MRNWPVFWGLAIKRVCISGTSFFSLRQRPLKRKGSVSPALSTKASKCQPWFGQSEEERPVLHVLSRLRRAAFPARQESINNLFPRQRTCVMRNKARWPSAIRKRRYPCCPCRSRSARVGRVLTQGWGGVAGGRTSNHRCFSVSLTDSMPFARQ